jgi:hypothetical protein
MWEIISDLRGGWLMMTLGIDQWKNDHFGN